MKGPSPAQNMKRGRSGGGRSAQLWGHRRQEALTMSTMAWSLLLLTLVALCTGDWMGRQGEGPGKTHGPCSLLSSLDPKVTISVSPPSRILGPGSSDSAVLCVRVPGPDGHHYLHWDQQQHRGWLLCGLVPTNPRIGPQTAHLWYYQSSLRGPGPILRL